MGLLGSAKQDDLIDARFPDNTQADVDFAESYSACRVWLTCQQIAEYTYVPLPAFIPLVPPVQASWVSLTPIGTGEQASVHCQRQIRGTFLIPQLQSSRILD